MPSIAGLLDAHAADVDEAAEHVGREAGSSSSVKNATASPLGGVMPAARSVSITSKPSQHAQIAVVASTGAHGVDVGARHDGLTVVLAIHDADDVADAVDGDREVEITHP